MTQVFGGGGALVLRGDAARLALPDDSVDLVVTSPPYFALRSYRDGDEHYDGQVGDEATPAEFIDALIACTREWMRVLKPTGSIFVNLGDKMAGSGGYNNDGVGDVDRARGPRSYNRNSSAAIQTTRDEDRIIHTDFGGVRSKSLMGLPWRYALRCIDELGLILRAELIWWKPNGLPESVTDRVARKHEQWFHMTLEPRYYSAIDELREAHVAPGRDFGNPVGKLPPSVWQIATEALVIDERTREMYELPEHFAAFPSEWPRRLILGWSPPGICIKCGEGRVPVTERSTLGSRTRTDPGNHRSHVPGYEDVNRGEWTDGVAYQIVGWACACTPRVHLRGERGDWREDREVEPELGNDDWSTPGNGVPRRKPEAVDVPEWQYLLESACLVVNILGAELRVELAWTPAPTRPAVVLDPFGGTGTSAMVARVLGRVGISNDLSHDYSRLARWRIFWSGDGRKAVARTLEERQGRLL